MSSNRNRLDQILRTAAEVLAYAVSEFDCKTFVIKGGATPCGFYYDFIFVNPFKEDLLPLIEERMRKIVADDEEIKIHEMIPMSAASFMRHNRRPYAAHFVEISPDPLVQVVQIGSFVDHVHGSFLKRTGELKALKLLKLEQRSDLYFKGEKKRVLRISGVAAESKEALKASIKKNKPWFGITHIEVGNKMGLFEVDVNRNEDYFEMARFYWTAQGEALFYNIYNFWRELHLKEKFELIITDSIQITRGHKKLYRISNKSCENAPVKFAEYRTPPLNGGVSVEDGLHLAKNCHKDRAHIFCLKKDLDASLKSSVTFLNSLPKLLEFNCTLSLSGSKEMLPLLEEAVKGLHLQKEINEGKESSIEWKIHDDFGQVFKGPFLTVRQKNEIFTIKRSLFSSVERMIAIILESHEKDLSQKKELLSKMGPLRT